MILSYFQKKENKKKLVFIEFLIVFLLFGLLYVMVIDSDLLGRNAMNDTEQEAPNTVLLEEVSIDVDSTEPFVPPSYEERMERLDALDTQKNPYNLSIEERRSQFDNLSN